jgi:hypothetical protein
MPAPAQPDTPPFVAKLITRFEAHSPRGSPGAIWSYRYKGKTVFYIPRLSCCDIMSVLYDVEGNVICRPDGGIAGSGNGKCPDFFAARKDERLLWRDARLPKTESDA